MPETPEQKARRGIDADLTAAGWLVQGRPLDEAGPAFAFAGVAQVVVRPVLLRGSALAAATG